MKRLKSPLFTCLLFVLVYPFWIASVPTPKAPKGLVHKKSIYGKIYPKSVVHSGKGLFFAQNMMYQHSITVYNRDYELVKTLSDEVDLSAYGHDGYKGLHQGSPVETAFSDDGKFAWVSNYQMYGKGFDNPGEDNCRKSTTYDKSYVYKVDTDSFHIHRVVEVGCVPKFIAVSPNGKYVIVSNWCSGNISIIDTEFEHEACTIEMGKYPRGIAIDSKSKYAYIAVMGSKKMAILDLEDFTLSFMQGIGTTPRHVCISPDDRYLYASLNHEGKIIKIDIDAHKIVDEIFVGATPRSMVLDDTGEYLYVVNYKIDRLTKVRVTDMKVIQQVATKSKPIGVTFDAMKHTVWVACYGGAIMVFEDQSLIQGIEGKEPFITVSPTPPKPKEKAKVAPSKTASTFYLIVASFTKKANAETAVANFKKQGIKTQILPSGTGFRVTHGSYKTKKAAASAANQLQQQHQINGWVLGQ